MWEQKVLKSIYDMKYRSFSPVAKVPLQNRCFPMQTTVLWKLTVLQKICGQLILCFRYQCFHDSRESFIFLVDFGPNWQSLLQISRKAFLFSLLFRQCSEIKLAFGEKNCVICHIMFQPIFFGIAVILKSDNRSFSKTIKAHISGTKKYC